jgi:predicted RNase H-like nuclease (RuvC/YqgF family)
LAFGIPVIVSCDKKKPPEYAIKLSARLGCRVISPLRDLLISEKKSACYEK